MHVFDSVLYGFASVAYRVILVFWAYVERFPTSESKLEEASLIRMVFLNFSFGFEYLNSRLEESAVVGLFDEIPGEQYGTVYDNCRVIRKVFLFDAFMLD